MIATDKVEKVKVKHSRTLTDLEDHPFVLKEGEEVQAIAGHVGDYRVFGIREQGSFFMLPAVAFDFNFNKFKSEI